MNYDARIDTADAQYDSSELGPLDGAEDEDRRSRRRVWIIGAICLAALIGLWFILHHGGAADSTTKGGNQAPAVTVISPGRGTIAGRINATGTLAARRELPVGVAGEGGQIAAVRVEPGQWVRQGQVLARSIARCRSSNRPALVRRSRWRKPMPGSPRPISIARSS